MLFDFLRSWELFSSYLHCKQHYGWINKNQWHSFFLSSTEYGILKHKNCEKYLVNEEDDGLHFHSGIDGSLFLSKHEVFYTNDEYCVDYFYFKDDGEDSIEVIIELLCYHTMTKNPFQLNTMVCFDGEQELRAKIQFNTFATLLSISAFFLGLTLVVYLFLPKLLNLHGKTVVCHVISLLLAYTFLSVVQFSTEVRLPFCLCIGMYEISF